MHLNFDHLREKDSSYWALLTGLQRDLGTSVYPFGSRYILGPDYDRGDTDVLVYAVNSPALVQTVVSMGYNPHISQGYAGMNISSYRREDVNLVLMFDDWEFYARAACVELCRTQQVTDKEDRRWLHKYIADVERMEREAAVPLF